MGNDSTSISCSQRNLTAIPCVLSQMTSNLLEFNRIYVFLDFNRLSFISASMFDSTIRILSLVLRGNTQLYLADDTFTGTPFLTELDISNLGLTKVSLALFAPLKNLLTLFACFLNVNLL
jgi:hypothetical protein